MDSSYVSRNGMGKTALCLAFLRVMMLTSRDTDFSLGGDCCSWHPLLPA